MKLLLNQIKKFDHHFQKGGKLERFHALWDMHVTILFTPDEVTETGPHVRDSMDIKRLMITVVIALVPCTLFGFYNTGLQSARAYGSEALLTDWQLFLNGALICMPIILVSYAVGGFWEVLFATIRGHKVSEGFLVTGLLFPLTLPPTVPLWQVAVGISFGVVIGKEIFGGTGMNILNPALTARVFLFFSYPAQMSGNKVWIYTHEHPGILDGLLFQAGNTLVDGFTGATALLSAAETKPMQDPVHQMLTGSQFAHFDLASLFYGFVPGSMGETSALMCLIGAVILILTGVGSWRIMVSTVAGALAMAAFLNLFAKSSADFPGLLGLPPHYHLVMGGFMFGAVFMATDPVSAAATNKGKIIYGILIGVMTILIRTWNPAYPEGMMLSILFMNIFAPLIDHFVVQSNINRRMKRATG
ncbi:MAG: NADH:ubiquinone reductase (Na(+)-transporting) subunit B [Leptospiraceae bacterium]|nr:NADH:ubiquinone reductase (Na(+)-transporting) subunit B [Leptospiraceae bacterium]MCB1315326.1 NADH:ubiquinone reductase (Na(+)-transporting) subunit B [Leptospiraceae bacterium]